MQRLLLKVFLTSHKDGLAIYSKGRIMFATYDITISRLASPVPSAKVFNKRKQLMRLHTLDILNA